MVADSKTCRFLLTTVICFVSLGLTYGRQAPDDPSVAPASELINWSGTVFYERSALVLTTAEQAAVVRFMQPKLFGSKSAGRFVLPYEWRSMTIQGQEETGTGRLVEDYKRSQTIKNRSTIRAGSLNIEWTGIDNNTGLYTFSPKRIQVQQIDRTRFANEDPKLAGQEVREAIPMQLFLESSIEVTQFFKHTEYKGQHTEPSSPREPLTTAIDYARQGLVVATPFGVGAIQFVDPVFENDGDLRRTGIRYRYHFHSTKHDSTGTGAGEVWEVTVDGKNDYSAARHFIEAGPIHVPWSSGGTASGWIYFDPAWYTISIVNPDEAAAIIEDPNWQRRLADFEFVERPPAEPQE